MCLLSVDTLFANSNIFPSITITIIFWNLFESRTKFSCDGNFYFYMRILLVALRRTCIMGITLWPKKKTITNLHTKLNLCILEKILCRTFMSSFSCWLSYILRFAQLPRTEKPWQIDRTVLLKDRTVLFKAWKLRSWETKKTVDRSVLLLTFSDRSVLFFFWRNRTVLFSQNWD